VTQVRADRPDRLVMVVGTGTGVGKTWVASALIQDLRLRGHAVSVRKPAQSFSPGETTDAEILGRASGEAAETVCPRGRWFERPFAPPMAAQALRRPLFTIADLSRQMVWPDAVCVSGGVGVVEGAGGVRSPLAVDGDAVDLVAALAPDLVVLVADAGLGTLNLVRMSLDALAGRPVVVYLNRFRGDDELHRRNREWLTALMGAVVDVDVGRLSRRVSGDPGSFRSQ
jgi:dethiobiotin synthetase